MNHRDVLPDGSLQLRTERCSFVYTRLAPSALLVTIGGYDDDQLGDATLTAIDDAIEASGPFAVFIDTRDATGVNTAVRERWTAWFQARKALAPTVTVLVSSRFFELTVAAAKLFAGVGDRLRVVSDVRELEAAIAREVPGFTRLPARARRASTDGAASIARSLLADGSLRLASGGVAHVVTRLRPGALRVTIDGDDRGELDGATFDELEAEIGRHRPLRLFVDLRGVTMLDASVREAWTAWFRAHRTDLERASIAVGSAFVAQIVEISRPLSGAGALIEVHADGRALDEELAREAP